MANKPITNQRTKQEIHEEVNQIDKEVPDTKEFVEIMEKENQEKESEENIEIVEDKQPDVPIVEEENTEEIIEESIEEEEEQLEIPKPKEKKELPPIEDRYREAGQEAMILNSKNKRILETIDEAENLPDPTLDELRAFAKESGAEYEELDTFAQNLLKETLLNKKYRGKIGSLVTEERKINEWVKKVEEFVDLETTIQTYVGLEDSREEFIKYCSKRSHVGADLDLLVAGFMFKQPVKRPSRGSVLLPSGKGSINQSRSQKPTELNEDDAALYRKTDPRRYKQLIKQRKFKITI
jgi:chemotaxis protein histidine kinase CheA